MQPTEARTLSPRDQALVLDRHHRGETILELGERYGVSHQRVSVLLRRAYEIVDDLDLQLMVAKKTGEVVGYIVPFSKDYTTAIQFGYWLIDKLRDRGMVVDIETRRTTDALFLFLSDVTPRRAKS